MALDNPILERIFSGEVPVAGRLAAAQGLLPLSREELLELAVRLRQDTDESVRAAAQETLFGFKTDELTKLGRGEEFSLETFLFLWRALKVREDLFEPVLLNSHMPARAVLTVAAECGPRLAEAVVINQQRLINYPEIIESLLKNPKTSLGTVRILYEVREQFLKERADLDPLFRQRLGVDELIRQSADTAPAPAPAPVAPPSAAAATEEPETIPAGAEVEEEGEGAEAPEEALEEEKTQEFANAYARVQQMNVPEKMRAALTGSREERSILIRDTAKLVCEAVLDSPKLNVEEVRSFVRLKSLGENIIRKISNNKDWMKDDVVLMGVVKHPKAPIALLSTLLVRLPEKAVSKLAKDKEVSEVVRRTVKRYIDAKERAKRDSAKKH